MLDDIIHFDTDDARVHHASWPIVRKVADLIRANPDILEVHIVGNADKIGTEEHNRILSRARADSVRKLIIFFGVEESRLTTEALGASKPRSTDLSENRRVEFIITKTRPGAAHAAGAMIKHVAGLVMACFIALRARAQQRAGRWAVRATSGARRLRRASVGERPMPVGSTTDGEAAMDDGTRPTRCRPTEATLAGATARTSSVDVISCDDGLDALQRHARDTHERPAQLWGVQRRGPSLLCSNEQVPGRGAGEHGGRRSRLRGDLQRRAGARPREQAALLSPATSTIFACARTSSTPCRGLSSNVKSILSRGGYGASGRIA